MKLRYIFFFMMLGLLACEEEPLDNPETNPPNYNAKMEIAVTNCVGVFCEEETPIAGISVKLYDMNPIEFPVLSSVLSSTSTSIDGIANFNITVDSLVYIYVKYEGKEYIEREFITPNAKSFHFARFSPYCENEGTELVNCDRKINFANPAVNQLSEYQAYTIDIFGDNPTERIENDMRLIVKIEEDLGNNQWLVSERFKSGFTDDGKGFFKEDEVVENIWQITETQISMVGEDSFSNLLPDNQMNNNGEIYSFSESDNQCAMNGWALFDCDTNSARGHVENQEINGVIYDRLNTLRRDRSATDGPISCVFYNQQDGITHTYIHNVFLVGTGVGLDLIN